MGRFILGVLCYRAKKSGKDSEHGLGTVEFESLLSSEPNKTFVLMLGRRGCALSANGQSAPMNSTDVYPIAQ
jgi:hypothetical protein